MRLYCLSVAINGFRRGRCTKKVCQLIPAQWGIQGWNPENDHEPGRLPGSGSFTWVGLFAVRQAAMEYLAQPNVFQVSVYTNSSRHLYVWNKNSNGTITGYNPQE
jgi:hypothetical protein